MDEITNQIDEVLKKYPFWSKGKKQEREFKKDLSVIIYKSDIKEKTYEKVSFIVNNIINTLKGSM